MVDSNGFGCQSLAAAADEREPDGRRSDAELLDAVAMGSRAALAELYRRYATDAWVVARRVVGDAGAEDVVQDVFVRLWRNTGSYDASRGSLRTYLTMLTRSRCLDLIKSEQARRSRETRDPVAPTVVDLRDDPATQAVVHVEIRDVVAALRNLAPEQREVIERAYFTGQTTRQIAAELELPEGTVKSRVRLGLQHLREAVCAPEGE